MEAVPGKNSNERIILSVKQVKAVTMNIRINGNSIEVPWASEIDITDYIKPQQEQSMQMELYGSLRNLLGPFHTTEEPEQTKDNTFRTEGQDYFEGYRLYPYGLIELPVLYRR